MAKEYVHNFAIKAAFKHKPKKVSTKYVKYGSKCLAVVINDNGILKAKLTTSPVEELNEFTVLRFTPDSFKLRGKQYVFAKHKDKYDHIICYIRDEYERNYSPGSNNQFDVLVEGLLIEGHIAKNNGINYFNYENLLAFTETGGMINNSVLIGVKE